GAPAAARVGPAARGDLRWRALAAAEGRGGEGVHHRCDALGQHPGLVPRLRHGDRRGGLMAPKVQRSLRDRLEKSFLERNTKIIGAIGVLLIVAFTIL